MSLSFTFLTRMLSWMRLLVKMVVALTGNCTSCLKEKDVAAVECFMTIYLNMAQSMVREVL